jgi:hypothetical protein
VTAGIWGSPYLVFGDVVSVLPMVNFHGFNASRNDAADPRHLKTVNACFVFFYFRRKKV